MILLDEEVVAKYDDYKVPPTHAMLIRRTHNSRINHEFPTSAYTMNVTHGELHVTYALGNLKDNVFYLKPGINCIEHLIDLRDTEEDTPLHESLPPRHPSYRHLELGGVVPDIEDPTKTVHTPGKAFGDMKVYDIDAVVCKVESRLKGIPVMNPSAPPVGCLN